MTRYSLEVEKILKQVADEQGVSLVLVRTIYTLAFKLVVTTIRKATKNEPDTFDSIRISHFGIFKMKYKTKALMLNQKKKKSL